MNSFQVWAKRAAEAQGFTVTLHGHWVRLVKGDLSDTCLSTRGVEDLLSRDIHGITLAHNPARPWFPAEAI